MVVGSHAERTAGNEPHVGLLPVSGRKSVRIGKTHGDLTLSDRDDAFPPHQQQLGDVQARSIAEPKFSIDAIRRRREPMMTAHRQPQRVRRL